MPLQGGQHPGIHSLRQRQEFPRFIGLVAKSPLSFPTIRNLLVPETARYWWREGVGRRRRGGGHFGIEGLA